jgi:thiamine-phosphate pyrophosphorylase
VSAGSCHSEPCRLPVLYAILDTTFFDSSQKLVAFAEELVAGGCSLMQYRNKSANARVMIEQARELKKRLDPWSGGRFRPPGQRHDPSAEAFGTLPPQTGAFGAPQLRLIMNDRADLCLAADFDGVHVGQDDLSPEAVRQIIGPDRWLGVSTHNPEQLREADLSSADYLAIGPVFTTSSKANPDPVVGLEGVRRARALTRKPLVAIGGVTRENAASVIDAGADSVAVISDLLHDPSKSAEEFFRILR